MFLSKYVFSAQVKEDGSRYKEFMTIATHRLGTSRTENEDNFGHRGVRDNAHST